MSRGIDVVNYCVRGEVSTYVYIVLPQWVKMYHSHILKVVIV